MTADGARLEAEVRNPVGDSDNKPLGWDEVEEKLGNLLGPMDATALRNLVVELPDARSMRAYLSSLATLGQ